MCWWTNALYDTCSIITLDKLLLDRPGMAKHFGPVQALEESFTADLMREETAGRARVRVTICPLPPTAELSAILTAATLSKSLAQVDTLVYATAVHRQVPVVTGDKGLARAVLARKLKVGNMALVLKELAHAGTLTTRTCEAVLRDLAARHDFLLGALGPTWANLRAHRFPD
jgi:hypothetical protein